MAASLAAHPSDYLAAANTNLILGPLTALSRQRPGFTQENTLYPGLVPIVLALVALVSAAARPRSILAQLNVGVRWRVVALALAGACALALTFELPYLTLIRLVPHAQVIRVPARWMIPASFALSALAGIGLSAAIRWLRPSPNHMPDMAENRRTWVLAAVLVALIVLESLSLPLPLAQAHPSEDQQPVYNELKSQAVIDSPSRWGVIELPMYVAPQPEYPETKRMLSSAAGWWGLVNGYSGLTPLRQTALAQDVSGFPDPASMEALRGLANQGVRYLVVHPDQAPLDPAAWQDRDRWSAESDATLRPAGQWGSAYLYLINPYGDQLVRDSGSVTDPFWSHLRPQPANVIFSSPANDKISLLAHSVTNGASQTQIVLYWQADTPITEDFTVFVHSLDASGVIVAQADGPPLAGIYPTSTWQPGRIVQDTRTLPTGDSYLVGLYNPLDGVRLSALSPTGDAVPNDAFHIVP